MKHLPKVLLVLVAALVAAPFGANTADAGGGTSHVICVEIAPGLFETLEIVSFSNGTAVLQVPGKGAGTNVELYGGRKAGGFLFATSLFELGGETGVVVMFNRDGTWCEYNFEGGEPDGDECGKWSVGECAPGRSQTGAFYEVLTR